MSRPRERRWQTYPNRWGEGRVHRYLYDRDNRLWYVACYPVGQSPHGREVSAQTPVTCKRCNPSA